MRAGVPGEEWFRLHVVDLIYDEALLTEARSPQRRAQ
jgi:hypothetical protein